MRSVLQPVLMAAVSMMGVVVRAEPAGPLSPAAALADLRLPDGLQIELVAAEPEIVDPVAMAFDEDARLWVVEMRDYPTLLPGKSPTSQIRILRDRDGDGRYESATTFAEGLLFPTGIQPWRGGAIVSLAGEVAYFPDHDRDDRADKREVWYRGFAMQNEQLRASHPTLAVDGRVYVAGGLRGGSILDVRDSNSASISINGRDFAFDPIDGNCDAVTGNGQFGMTFDDEARRFTCSNRNPLMQVMIEQRYLQRNPQYLLPVVVQDVAAAGDASRLFPRSRGFTTANSHAGQFTAACSAEIYRGDGLPADYRGNAFICEPTANLVHCEIVDSSGVACASEPRWKNREFLASTDEWFRPVNLAGGPDGALYVVDMYRLVIEHPAWMPIELRDRADLLHGADRGRIYRITPTASRAQSSRTDETTPEALLELLEHSNGWHRETAARLLRERSSANLKALRRLATTSNYTATRVQALWLLADLQGLDEQTIVRALSDTAPGVRVQALVLAERQLVHSTPLMRCVLQMATDDDPRVRFQVALSLLSLPPEDAVAPLVEIAIRDATDLWTCRAVALASRQQAGRVLVGVLQQSSTKSGGVKRYRDMIRELAAAMVSTGDAALVAGALAQGGGLEDSIVHELLLGITSALDGNAMTFDVVWEQLEIVSPSSYAAMKLLFEQSIASAEDERNSLPRRIEAVQLARHDRRADATEALLRLTQNGPDALQAAAIQALTGRMESRISESLLAQFGSQLPSVRRASLDLLLETSQSSLALLSAIEANRIAATDIDAPRSERLLQHANAQVRSLAERLLGTHSTDRTEVVQQYQHALSLAANGSSGRQIFAAHCAACHRLNGEGTAIGPDIGDSALRTSEQLLADILQPNLAVDSDYLSYVAVAKDGRVYQGVIRSESEAGIAMQTADGKSVSISRRELESLTSSGHSLMPEGLELQINPQQMADLIAYLKGWREVTEAARN